ncbi:GAF domain-containing sensor histidine kinase [Egicoccus halophilus]|uniref:histidine kinase n=1 Tax=Egicoccus halophilus TaxID=1670830 RepID=A0A8J3A779_9ACTN|nr:ATP-binding protein [Egicoccus halophilus]GGI03479.1 hypothetical protein GCM10011354_04250 [Egicoccus halophilus]
MIEELLAYGVAVGVAAGLVTLATARWGHERARVAAERRAQLLVSVLRTDRLATQDVLAAVVDGLSEAGFDAVSIRLIDHAAGHLRYVAGRGVAGEVIVADIPLGTGFAGQVLRAGRPLVLDDYGSTPGVLTPALGFAGTIGVPLGPAAAPVAVMLAARLEGTVTRAQHQAALLLAEQAGRALDRALRFEQAAQTVAQLRVLDARTQDFVSIVSHELRTPLTVIQGLGQTLAQRWDDLGAERRADLSGRIDANGERLAGMVRSLLESSALEEGRLDLRVETVVLAPLVEAVLHRLTTVTTIHPVTVSVPDHLSVRADAGLLAHVLENLFTNVAKHTPPGTPVALDAVEEGEMVRVRVADQGPGILPEDLPHVLERFHRGGAPTRRTTGGLGLGLALANQIVAAHGGRLEASSVPGEGTTFTFRLPTGSHPRAATGVRSGH